MLQFLAQNWHWIAPAVYEIVVRLFPSKKSISLINGVKNIADTVIPNFKDDGTKHK